MLKSFVKRFMAIVCIALMLMPVVVYASSTKQELDKAQKQEEERQKELEAVQSTINALKGDITDTENYIDALDTEMNSIAQDIVELNGKIDKKNEEIAITTQNLELAQQAEQEQYEAMKLRIKYMYENSDTNYFNIMLMASDISELLNRAEYVTKISEYDRNKLEEFVATKEAIAAYKVQLEKEEQELQEFKVELETEQQAVELLLNAKTEEMNRLQADKKAYEAKQKEIEKSIEELDALITQLTNQYNAEQLAKANAVATQGALYSNSLLLWPCPSSYRITSHFSPSRLDPVTGSYYSAHKGTDIGAPTGTPVIAAASGLVTAAGFSASMGNYIVISHGDGITTRYYHNSSLAVSAGQAVKGGQTISYVGSTGWSTGPHLHFEVRINDSPVDPMQFFSR